MSIVNNDLTFVEIHVNEEFGEENYHHQELVSLTSVEREAPTQEFLSSLENVASTADFGKASTSNGQNLSFNHDGVEINFGMDFIGDDFVEEDSYEHSIELLEKQDEFEEVVQRETTPVLLSENADLASGHGVELLDHAVSCGTSSESNGTLRIDGHYFDIASDILNGIVESISTKLKYGGQGVCNICGRKFHTSTQLQRHIKFHKRNKIYYCSVCGKDFGQRSHLGYHMAQHTGIKRYSCELCHRRFAQKFNLNFHMKMHNSKPSFSCTICDKKFWKKCDLRYHVEDNHDKKTDFSCKICNTFYTYKRNLARHMLTHPPFICKTCDKEFKSMMELLQHRKSHKMAKLLEKTSPKNREFRCDVCGRTFCRIQSLTFHSKSHTQVYKCTICDAKFFHKGFLKGHMLYHSDEKPYKCETCGKAFKRKHTLSYHMKTHSDVKPFVCKICGCKFHRKNNLTMHNRWNCRKFIPKEPNFEPQKVGIKSVSHFKLNISDASAQITHVNLKDGTKFLIGRKMENLKAAQKPVTPTSESEFISPQITNWAVLNLSSKLLSTNGEPKFITVLNGGSTPGLQDMLNNLHDGPAKSKMTEVMTIKEGDSDPFTIKTM